MEHEHKHELLENTVDRHDKKIEECEKRINTLERENAIIGEKIVNLCDKLSIQTKSINALIALLGTTILGIVVYGLQQVLFK